MPFPTSTTASPSARAASVQADSTTFPKWRQRTPSASISPISVSSNSSTRRQLKFVNETDFYENGHQTQDGNVDIYAIVKALEENGFSGYVRPDHGRNIWGEEGKPGYGLYDRALGAAYLSGLFEAVRKGVQK